MDFSSEDSSQGSLAQEVGIEAVTETGNTEASHQEGPQVLCVCSLLLIDSRVQMWLLSSSGLLLNTFSVWDISVCPVLRKVCSESLFRVRQEEGGVKEGF